MEDEEDVYETVAEDQYEEMVRKRRDNQEDFVVDDNGAGYADDGEEWIGANEDEKKFKKRSAQERLNENNEKLSKKARSLLDAGARQQGAIKRFASAGVKETSKSKKTANNRNIDDMDIDNMLGASNAHQQGKGSSNASYAANPSTSLAVNQLKNAQFARGPRPVNKRVAPRVLSQVSSSSGAGNSFLQDNDLAAGADAPVYDQDYDDQYQGQEGDTGAMDMENNTEVPEHTDVDTAGDANKTSFSKTSRTFKIKNENLGEEAVSKNTPGGAKAAAFNRFEFDNNSFEGTDAAASQSAATNMTDIPAESYILQDETSEKEGGPAYMDMFFLDATEEKSSGVIYLFGKVLLKEDSKDGIKEEGAPAASKAKKNGNKFVSCCVAVHNCERNLFVLPRGTGEFNADGSEIRVPLQDVWSEINDVLVPSVIPRKQGNEFRVKMVKRNYAFDDASIPREETDYMKVVYSIKHGVPKRDVCEGGKTYEHIFGSGSTGLELFLLKRKIKGPGWIRIRKPQGVSNAFSYSKLEIGVLDPKLIKPVPATENLPTPPVTTMAVSMKTIVNPRTHMHELVAISGLVYHKVDMESETRLDPKQMDRFTFIRPLGFSAGEDFPPRFPHDLQDFIKRQNCHHYCHAMPNERALIAAFLNKVQTIDPDVMASHNLFGFEFDVILSRAKEHKVASWDRLGKLKRSRVPKNINDPSLCGRLFCDTYKASKEFLRETTYSLTHLTEAQLKKKRIEVDPIDVPRFFSNSGDIFKIYQHTENDTLLVQSLMFSLQCVPLTCQLTRLSGNLWSRTMRGARAERIEFLLLHEFHMEKYILPEKIVQEWDNGKKDAKGKKGGKSGSGGAKSNNTDGDEGDNDDELANNVGGHGRKREKASYAGGLVLEPKKGLYDTMVLLLDFNSLYPSIIQEYNLCFTTVNYSKFLEKNAPVISGDMNVVGEEEENEALGNLDAGAALPPLPDPATKQGILPRVIKTLVARRREVKNVLKNERNAAKKQMLDIRQKALKLTANSMYGCLGFSFSRFFAKPIAALITAKGREALQRTVDLSQRELQLDVIYGDTDSVMINSNSKDFKEVMQLGHQVKSKVNELYRDLELDIDGVFSSMLLLKKKKYAAVVVSERNGTFEYEKELKGLDLVRRDWCALSKDTGRWVVDKLLSGQPKEEIVMEIHDYMSEIAAKIKNNQIDLNEFVVRKGLNKNPKDYPDSKGQPHLQVAIQMLKQQKPVNVGDHIPYVICTQTAEEFHASENGTNVIGTPEAEGKTASTKAAPAAQRAFHPDDVLRADGKLKLDFEWYLTNQLLPPISRLCEPIEGTSSAILANKLGIDSSKYQQTRSYQDDEDDWNGFVPKSHMSTAERYKDCVKLTYCCGACNVEQEFPGLENCDGASGLTCASCGSLYLGRNNNRDCYAYLSNRVTLLVRECVKKYYQYWLVCDDMSCRRTTMQQSANGYACTADCHGRMLQLYTDEQLHTQLIYLESLFDYDKANQRKIKMEKEKENADENTLTKLKPDLLADIVIPDHKSVYSALNEHMANSVNGSAFNWIRPSLWSTIFGNQLAAK